MERKERRRAVLAALLVGLAALAVYRFGFAPSWRTPAASNGGAKPAATQAGKPAPGTAPDVRLDALEAARPTPVGGERDLFRFKPKPLPPSPPARAATTGTGPNGTPTAPAGALPPPPIPLKFIGIVETPDHTKIAVLTDGRAVIRGGEGQTVDGRYKILHIGVESIEMSYLDGRGRQTIRLTGS